MEKSILIFCGLLALSQGRVVDLQPRVVNGVDAKEGEIPFQVSLQQQGFHFCGGSILNENYVVTAAHCVVSKTAPQISVICGTINKNKPRQKRQAVKIIVHENYTPSDSHRNDIALIKIDHAFTFTKYVQPVHLPEFHAKISSNAPATVSGWGRLGGSSGLSPDILQKAQIWVADQEYCRNAMKNQNADIYPTNICAYDPSTRRGQCNGDSGGPLIVEGKLTGIVSWSIKDPYCASTEYPGVYTRVPEFIDWIFDNAV